MSLLLDRAVANTSTIGTGTVTLGSAATAPAGEANYLSWSEAGAADGKVYDYLIQEGNDFEIGYGTYAASGTTLTRNVIKSKVGGSVGTSLMNLAGAATVACVASKRNHNVFLTHRLSGSSTGGQSTIDVNSTSYVRSIPASVNIDRDLHPFTHYRLLISGNSSQAGQTISAEMRDYNGGANSVLHTGGNDITGITNSGALWDSGWITSDRQSDTGLRDIDMWVKGSNSTVDLAHWYALLLTKIEN